MYTRRQVRLTCFQWNIILMTWLLGLSRSVFSLGSTRFMKVARGRNSEGTCVWKVFLTQEDSSAYEPYRKELFRIRDALLNAPNCCTVKKIYVTPKWAVLIRPFQKQTLCDRLSTRPFIVQQEKIWYIYQLFKAIAQCQKANVCHGDLKSQNVLLSSSNWLQITDFAPYKPTYLPHDNPSSFTFFFDTSRHQHCYLAPERFLSSVDYENIHKEKGDEWLFGSLQSSMDLFAVGCVVYELLHESGKPPFSYGELCHYQRMSSSDAASFLERLLQDIAPQFRPLLKLLLNRDPSLRVSAQQVLDGSVLHFPKVLDAFFSYLNAFRPKEITTSQSLEGFEQSQMTFHLEPDDVIAKLKRDEKSIWERLTECEENRPYAILFISLIKANIRVLRSVPAKIDAMNLLVKLASLCSPVVSTERVLPYLVCCLSEVDAQVRASAVYSITELLRPIEPATFEDSLVFIDYLLPELSSMLTDKRHPCPTHVLLAVATNLGDIAETAYRFHVVGRNLRNGVADDEISGAENISDDTILKPNKKPLNSLSQRTMRKVQGLHDFEELVVIYAIHCIIVLVETGVLGRNEMLELLEDTLPFLSHPNEWIRVTVVELLIVLDSRWSLADVHCRLLPLVRPYLQDSSLLRLNNKLVVLTCLKSPIPRDVWKKVTEMNRGLRGSAITCNDSWFTRVFGRDTLDSELFEKLARFNRLLLKMAEFRRTAGMEAELTQHKGIIDLSSKQHAKVRRNAHNYVTSSISQTKVIAPADMNSEWNEMFGDTEQINDEKSSEERNAAHLLMQTRSMRTSVCGAQLAELLQHKNELFHKKLGSGGQRRSSRPGLSNSKVTGTLLTHLHEHTDKVTQLAAQPDRARFASASLDGYVLLWNSRNVVGDGPTPSVRSDASFLYNRNYPIPSIGWASNEIIAAAIGDGHVLWVDCATSEPRIVTKVRLPKLEGPPEQIHVSNNVTYLRSHHGAIYCLDLSFVTSFVVDPIMENWMVMCSTNNELMLWDLR
ncbi:HEAT repeat protein [Cooperia oncophora]